ATYAALYRRGMLLNSLRGLFIPRPPPSIADKGPACSRNDSHNQNGAQSLRHILFGWFLRDSFVEFSMATTFETDKPLTPLRMGLSPYTNGIGTPSICDLGHCVVLSLESAILNFLRNSYANPH